MSPAPVLLSAAERAAILRRLLLTHTPSTGQALSPDKSTDEADDRVRADGCRILLTPEERAAIGDAIDLYEEARQ